MDKIMKTMMIFLLKVKLYISIKYTHLKYLLFNISEFLAIINDNNNNNDNNDNNNNNNVNKKSLYFNYFIINIITKLINLLKRLRSKCDKKIDKVEIVKNYKDGNKKIIICPKTMNKNEMSITDVVKFIDNFDEKKSNNLGKKLFMKFEIDCPKFGKLNMKEYLIMYKDHENKYSHTIKNILLFNDHDISKDAKLDIKIFNCGKILNKSFLIKDVENDHISNFYE